MSELTLHRKLNKPELKHALTELLGKQLIETAGSQYRATGRWHAALARAARFFAEHREIQEDIRLPISKALIDIYGDELSENDLLAAVEIMLDIQSESIQDIQRH